MKQKTIFSLLLFFCFSLSFLLALPAYQVLAQDSTLNGLNTTAGKINAFEAQTKPGAINTNTFLSSKVGTIIGLILSFIGVLFLILMIYAGITWMTSEGNEQKITQAKGLIINAIIGIIIVFAAYALTTFLGDNLLN